MTNAADDIDLDPDAIDLAAVRADDALVEELRAGGNPLGQLNTLLAALRDEARATPTT